MKSKSKERIAFQGERGAFSEEAVHRLLGDDAVAVPCPWFDAVFKSLEQGEVTGAVIPIENTLHGSVHENYDHLLHFELPIVGETNVRIVHNLIAAPGVRFNQVKRVYSHPVALAQCLKFFAAHPEIERVPFYDTAGSVKMLMEQSVTDAAGIASSLAADAYGAQILRRSIEDDRANFTRFFLLRPPGARIPEEGEVAWKTSIVFTTRNTPGALFRSLSALALRDLSLTKIESRPFRGRPWEYLFYVDFLGHVAEPRVENALRHIGEQAELIRVLGCYPKSGTA
ncbi:MAG TPA: prephenate dehydratase [Bryobacteraceae bacterium]